jgi:glycosyltransferase involved in cell wall biosynthesis
MTQPLVSIAIVTYNQINYLRECIESVLIQDYLNTEIVVADDCSTDGTVQMLLEYVEKYPGKFVLQLANKNNGITINSNNAHFACTGKYIAWMAGDDLMLPGKISSQVDLMEKDINIVLSYHNLDVFDSESGKNLYYYNNGNIEGGVKLLVKHGTVNGACATMVRRCAAPQHGFDVRIPIASDWLYWVQSTYGGGKIRYIDKVLGKHRRHAGNVTNSENGLSLKIFQDHLLSCSIIISEKPELHREVEYRMAELLIAMRMINNGQYYRNYLKAALSFSFRPKAMAGILISYFGIKF